MDLRHLQHFLAVVRAESVSRAATETGISQSGLTKSIRTLEASLGAELLDRMPRGVRPNMLGRALARRAATILAHLGEAEAEIEALREGAAGTLSVGAGPSWMRRGLPEAVAKLVAQSPRIEISVLGGFDANLLRLLKRGELDLVIAACELATGDDALEVLPLTHDRQAVIARRDHALAGRAGLKIADLKDAAWALPSREMAQRQRFNRLFGEAGFLAPDPTVESDSIAFVFEIVRRTDLLSFTTSTIFQGGARDDIISLEVAGLDWERHAGVICRAGEERSPLAERLWQLLAEVARDMHVN